MPEDLAEFGIDFLVQGKVGFKAVGDIAFQRALHVFFGRTISSWEPTSTTHYHAGRCDVVQKADAYQDEIRSQYGKTARLVALLSPSTK
ncbi:hypothetical protein MMC27_000475 [Xylographa pallens]|nr:hypothetical protein [Xylographa pallens]